MSFKRVIKWKEQLAGTSVKFVNGESISCAILDVLITKTEVDYIKALQQATLLVKMLAFSISKYFKQCSSRGIFSCSIILVWTC